ncbi:MAG: aminoacyl-tRNA hydrolase [bacterium]|nr:aminoacyl-tRNA hydrolase [bacterium]
MKYLIVGLGNPGKKYARNRHNIGFLSLDSLSGSFSVEITKKYKQSLIATLEWNQKTLVLMKPLTFMNASGDMVQKAVATYKIPLSHLIVIYDDIDFPLGRIKIRKGGSSGGHKGVQSIIDSLQNGNFIRVRIGINSEYKKDLPLEEFVLNDFNKPEVPILQQVLKQIPDVISRILDHSVDKAMNEFN